MFFQRDKITQSIGGRTNNHWQSVCLLLGVTALGNILSLRRKIRSKMDRECTQFLWFRTSFYNFHECFRPHGCWTTKIPLEGKKRIGRYKQGDIIYDALVAGIDLLTPVYKVPVKYGSWVEPTMKHLSTRSGMNICIKYGRRVNEGRLVDVRLLVVGCIMPEQVAGLPHCQEHRGGQHIHSSSTFHSAQASSTLCKDSVTNKGQRMQTGQYGDW